jgi:sterol desaturase/sphingolipid hydroxylase (fatty acid hydroxylase superfamily)
MTWALFSALQPALIAPLVLIAAGLLIERWAPAEPSQPTVLTGFNILHTIFLGWIRIAAAPLLGIAATMVINACGGGLIGLAGSGWLLIPSAIAYLLVIDFLEFAFHRAQHAFPFLWAMHSFHHSDTAVNVSTATRNYWLEIPIKALLVYPIAAILFRVPAAVLTIYAISTVWHAVNHLNVRWQGLVPWYVLNNPQFHRIHHSTDPKHHDKNFSPYFPLWDLIGGTAYVPAHDEYPRTGLGDEEAPQRLAEAILWPWRWKLRQHATHTREPSTPPA